MNTSLARISLLSCLVLATTLGFSQRPPRVLIDGSHEFSFAWSTDWWDGTFARSYLGASGIPYTYSWATLDTVINRYDVVVTYQVTTAVPYPKVEQNLLRSYVAAGGGLLIVGKGPSWDRLAPHQPGDAYPLSTLSSLFGMQFSSVVAGKPFRFVPHTVTAGAGGFENGGLTSGTLMLSAGVDSLLVDPAGKVVMAAAQYGLGRVIAIAENDCVPTSVPLPAAVRNDTLLLHAIRWLGAALPAHSPQDSVPRRVYPEKTSELGALTVRYGAALSVRVGFMTSVYPFITAQLESMMGVRNVSTLSLVALATGGGGYSGGDEIGVGILTDDKPVFGVLAHELTHSFQRPGGEPTWMGEGWGTLSAFRVQTAYGYDMRNDRQTYETQFRAVDPDGQTMDLSTSEHANEAGYPSIPAYMGKCMWVVESLEQMYRADLMRRYFVLARKYPLLRGTATGQVIYRLSAAAGRDLHPYFQSIGTTVAAKPVLPLVLSTTPDQGSDASPSQGYLRVTFTEPMDTSSVAPGSLQMEGSVTGILTGTRVWEDSLQTLVVILGTRLQESETVTVTLLPSCHSLRGLPLDGNGNGVADGGGDAFRCDFRVGRETSGALIEEPLPEKMILWQNYPNPFNAETTIRFQIPAPAGGGEAGAPVRPVTLRVFDVLGRETATLLKGERTPGLYTVTYRPETTARAAAASGPYFYTLESQAHRLTKCMLLLR